MTISVVIPVWNGRAELATLLASLAKQTVPANEIIVVDNGSVDGAGDLAAGWGARVIGFPENRGFAVAVNRGVSESCGELLAILNSDVELEPTWTEALKAALNWPDAWFATGLTLSAAKPDRIDGTWDLVSQAGMAWRAGAAFPVSARFQQDRPIQLASFTALLLRRRLWDRVGPLDERFESYLEDVDFGLRCVSAGCSGRYVAAARCRHKGSATLGRWNRESVRRISRNQIFLLYKHFGPGTPWWNVFAGQVLWGLMAAKHGAGAAWVTGKWQGWKQRGRFVSSQLLPPHALLAQEAEILELQRELGFDSYWRWYAFLTGQWG